MDKVFEEDNRLITQDKPASRKLSYCSELEKDLKNVICSRGVGVYLRAVFGSIRLAEIREMASKAA